MKFLFYFENVINPLTGGTERASYNLATSLENCGHEIYVLAKYFSQEEIKFKNFYLPSELLVSSQNIDYIESLVLKYQIDYIINEGGNTADVQLFNHLALNINAKIITCLHFSALQGFGREYYSDLDLRNFKNILRIFKMPVNKRRALKLFQSNYSTALKHTDAFVVLNEVFKKQILELTGQYGFSNKISVIPNINTLIPENDKSANKENIVLYVGRLQYGTKRVDRLLKSWAFIEDQILDWKLIILGDGPDRLWYESLRNKMNLKNVFFKGRQNPTDYYRRAKIITLVSTHESFGMTLVEGMAHGCVPIVFNSYPTAGEILQNGKCGTLIKPFSIEVYASELLNLCKNEQLLSDLSQRSILQSRKFSSSNIISSWIELLKQL